jgi:hypothetical protein
MAGLNALLAAIALADEAALDVLEAEERARPDTGRQKVLLAIEARREELAG